MNPTYSVRAEITQCQDNLARVERRLAELDVPNPLTCAQATHEIAALNLRLTKLLQKARWGTFRAVDLNPTSAGPGAAKNVAS